MSIGRAQGWGLAVAVVTVISVGGVGMVITEREFWSTGAVFLIAGLVAGILAGVVVRVLKKRDEQRRLG